MTSVLAPLGPYKLVQKVGTGGMADLFLATMNKNGLETLVALKRILPGLAEDAEFLDAFRVEAELVSKLAHPSVVNVFDWGEIDGQHYIAMEYVSGRNLASVAKRVREKKQRLSPEYLAYFLGRVASGLHHAHTLCDEQGKSLNVIHRDVSPQNIIVAFDGDIKLVDFGIAKVRDSGVLTKPGVIKGKMAYVSPEQVLGGEVDARSDLFAVGIVLYEMLTGLRPFERDQPIETIQAIAKERHVDPRELLPSLPEAMNEIVNRCLEKAPERRFSSAKELGETLDRFVADSVVRCDKKTIGRWMERQFAVEKGSEDQLFINVLGFGDIALPDLDETPFGELSVVVASPYDRGAQQAGCRIHGQSAPAYAGFETEDFFDTEDFQEDFPETEEPKRRQNTGADRGQVPEGVKKKKPDSIDLIAELLDADAERSK